MLSTPVPSQVSGTIRMPIREAFAADPLVANWLQNIQLVQKMNLFAPKNPTQARQNILWSIQSARALQRHSVRCLGCNSPGGELELILQMPNGVVYSLYGSYHDVL